MLVYIIIGLIWAGWLEYYTTSTATELLNRSWTWFERIFHTLFWFISMGVFVYTFITEYFKNR